MHRRRLKCRWTGPVQSDSIDRTNEALHQWIDARHFCGLGWPSRPMRALASCREASLRSASRARPDRVAAKRRFRSSPVATPSESSRADQTAKAVLTPTPLVMMPVAKAIDDEFLSEADPTPTRAERGLVAQAGAEIVGIVGFTRYLGWGALAALRLGDFSLSNEGLSINISADWRVAADVGRPGPRGRTGRRRSPRHRRRAPPGHPLPETAHPHRAQSGVNSCPRPSNGDST